jgi:hypothetical protein
MAEVVKFPGNTLLPTTPKKILQQAKSWDMDRCLVIGEDAEGKLKFGGSFCEAGDVLMMLELAKKFILENHFARQN